ncbi:hypothetical protein AWENTII_007026 [Aspergillus wentii]
MDFIFQASKANVASMVAWISFLVSTLAQEGPKLAASTKLCYLYWTNSGRLHYKVKELHDQYGDVVRIAPNFLVYKAPPAWKDIYGHRKHGDGSFLKDPQFYIPTPSGHSLIGSNDADHSRERRLLSHAFSEKSLREQESLVQSYVDLLINGLYNEIEASRETVDLTKWYNFTTFDIIGDLVFGEPFNCLRDNRYHPWVSIVFGGMKSSTILRGASLYGCLAPIIKSLIPKSVLQKRMEHHRMTQDKLNRRLEMKTTRPDFMTYVLRYNDERGMTQRELEANSSLLIIAGSETTATLLSGCTFYLLRHPEIHKKLINEVRGSFQTQEEINFLSVAKLSYMNCVLEESLRMYPPVPGVLPRRVPDGGAMIDGEFIPEGTSVSMGYYSAFRAESNFAEPDSFIPERWSENKDPAFASDNKEVLQPFSYGPRNCLGKNLAYAEMRLIMAKVLWNFDLSLDSDSYNWDIQPSYTIWQKHPLNVKLTPVQR